ncbi:MAG TPA: ABC transporter permease [Gemmatimonadaceae bacterium]|nr:ABC transporter permease [Gemmatimonadaceae bacterium]
MSRKPVYRRLFDLRLGGRRRSAAEMDLEIESHLAMRTADLVAAGRSPADARAEALRRFGDIDAARTKLHAAARHRDAALRQRHRIGALYADARYAVRQARRAPGFTALAVGALAIGIGSATAMFTLVDHVLLQPLPFPRPDRLVAVFGGASNGAPVELVSSADWLDWRRAKSFEGSAIRSFPYRRTVVTPDSAIRIDAEDVSGNYFDVLRPRFVAGRAFTEREAQVRTPEVVISERLWNTLFDRQRIGQAALRTATQTYAVVGVLAPGEEFPAGTDAWFPLAFSSSSDPVRVDLNYYQIARLSPGATAAQATAEVSTIARGIRAADPSAIYDYGATAAPLTEYVSGDASGYLKLLMGVVVFVLLIVCANVAAASLARGATRTREMAVRASLGAGRARLVQQLLVEQVAQGLAAGGLGLFLAWAAVRGILARWGGDIPRANEVSLDGGVLAFAVFASLAAGTLAGVLPALRTTRAPLRNVLASGGRTTARGGRRLAGATLVIGEIALALLLLIGAGLLIRSFRSLLGRGLGFDTNVATAEITLTGPRFASDTARRFAYWDALMESYRSIPGVRHVAATNFIPLGLTGQGFIDIEGRDEQDAGAVYRSVSDDFFQTLAIPIVAGRAFDRAQDRLGTPRVAVINQKMAATYWPGQNPIGKRVRARSMEGGGNRGPAPWLTIVGVVGDVRTYGLESQPRAEMYVAFRQVPARANFMTVAVRGDRRASTFLHAMKAAARAIDPSVPVDLRTLDDRLRDTLSIRTLILSFLTGFASLALALAALGIYGVLSFAVAQRTRELAVRAALGAQRGQLLALVLAAGAKVVAIGLVLGMMGALLLTRSLASMLVGIGATDPATYASAIIVLVAASGCAILIPALRATRLDPNIALQAE